MIRALVAGERDPDVLASYRDVRCHSSIETIRAALIGNDRDEHIFALAQSLELYDVYQTKIADCERLETAVRTLTARPTSPTPLPKARFRQKPAGAPAFDVRAALHGVLGVDLTQIHGIGPSLALKLVAECGTDLASWPSAKHFTSWLCLAPGNRISGGKLLSSRTQRSSSRAAALLRLAAVTIGRSDTALGAFYRRLSSRVSKQKAVTATARKIATIHSASALRIVILVPLHITNVIELASSPTSSAAPGPSATIWRLCPGPPVFLRKAALIFGAATR